MAELQYNEISQLLNYDPETGKLYWIERPVEMFRGGGKTSQAHICRAWNTRFAGLEAFKTNMHGYLSGRINGKTYRAHRIIWLLHYGSWPTQEIDHIDGDRSNNLISNLRDVSHVDNNKNKKVGKLNKSGVIGVYWDAKRFKWAACINVSYKTIPLGRFSNKEDAIKARKEAEQFHGFHPNHSRLEQ